MEFSKIIVIKDELYFNNDTTSKNILKTLFKDIHAKNMLKIFKEDGKFHFEGKKVIKPDHWHDEVDNTLNFKVSSIIDKIVIDWCDLYPSVYAFCSDHNI